MTEDGADQGPSRSALARSAQAGGPQRSFTCQANGRALPSGGCQASQIVGALVMADPPLRGGCKIFDPKGCAPRVRLH